jgi:hypothetical protein
MAEEEAAAQSFPSPPPSHDPYQLLATVGDVRETIGELRARTTVLEHAHARTEERLGTIEHHLVDQDSTMRANHGEVLAYVKRLERRITIHNDLVRADLAGNRLTTSALHHALQQIEPWVVAMHTKEEARAKARKTLQAQARTILAAMAVTTFSGVLSVILGITRPEGGQDHTLALVGVFLLLLGALCAVALWYARTNDPVTPFRSALPAVLFEDDSENPNRKQTPEPQSIQSLKEEEKELEDETPPS